MKIITAKELNDIDSSNYIHDSVVFVVHNEKYGVTIGKNNIILAGCVIHTASGYRENTVIGSNNYIGTATTIQSDSIIGNYNTLEGSNFIGHHACILNNTLIEAGATISPYSTVGSWATVGTLTPLIKDVKPFSKIFGNPAVSKGVTSSKAFKDHFSEVETLEIKQYIKDGSEPVSPYIVSIIDEFSNQSRKKAL